MIYPVIQKNNLNGKQIEVKNFYFSGDCTETAEKVFSEYSLFPSDGYEIEIVISDCRKTNYIEEEARLTDEKYFITANENKAVIEAAAKRGVFRALHTLAQLI